MCTSPALYTFPHKSIKSTVFENLFNPTKCVKAYLICNVQYMSKIWTCVCVCLHYTLIIRITVYKH